MIKRPPRTPPTIPPIAPPDNPLLPPDMLTLELKGVPLLVVSCGDPPPPKLVSAAGAADVFAPGFAVVGLPVFPAPANEVELAVGVVMAFACWGTTILILAFRNS